MRKLTKKSKWMLYLSIFISGIVIFTMTFYFISAKNSPNPLSTIILIIILILAALSVLSMWISRATLRKNTSALSLEFFEAYEKISDKFHGTAMSGMEKKEILSDILDIFLLADKDNKNLSDVIGQDIDQFVVQIQESLGYRSKLIFNLLTGAQYSIVYMLMMQGAEYIKSGTKTFFNMNLSLSLSFFLIGIAFVGIPLLTHFIRKNKIVLAALSPIAILALYIAAMEILDKYFINTPWVYRIIEGEINFIPNVWILILWIAAFASATMLKFLQRKISISKL
ncbi:MAG: DUF1048 domain-containing protein [Eubacteriales bacterium]